MSHESSIESGFKRRAAAVLLACLPFGCSHEVGSPSVTLEPLEPDLLCNEQFPEGGIDISVKGTGFTPLPVRVLEEPAEIELPSLSFTLSQTLDGSAPGEVGVQFSGKLGGLNAERLTWHDDKRMDVSVDESLTLVAGVYDLTLTNPDERSSATRAGALVVVPPPVIEGIRPDALCNGFQDQVLTVTGQNFVEVDGVGPSVRFDRAGGEGFSYQSSDLDGCNDLSTDGRSLRICTSASVTIPASTLPEDTYDLSIAHPEPLGCGSTESQTLNVLDDGPVLFFADPPVAYSGINTRVTLMMTSVAEPFTVELSPAGETGPLSQLDSLLVAGTTNRIQATIPANHASGTFDVTVNDDTGCLTTLSEGVTVTSDLTIELGSVADPFGQSVASTSITIFRSGGTPFEATPRAFLNPSAGASDDVAIQLGSVTWINEDELTAIVPAGTPLGLYDLVVVNPSGGVGLLEGAFESLLEAPPVIIDVVPQSIVNQADQGVVVTGTGFSGSSVSLRCQDLDGNDLTTAPGVTTAGETCNAGECTLTAVVDGSALNPGDACVVRVENAVGSYGEFSALGASNSSYNLSAPRAGRPLTVARRGPVAAAVKVSNASRYVYALGGDSGTGTEALSSVEVSPINVFGGMSDFAVTRQSLASARVRHAGSPLGRYLYVVGGETGGGALSSAERALVLSPDESPVIGDLDLCLSESDPPCFDDAALGSGLAAGEYAYRVAALIDPADPQNLGGETLASDPLPLKLPEVQNRGILVRLLWDVPRDVLGNELTGVIGYRVYRTPVDGVAGRDEVLLAQIDDAAARSFIDDGTATPGSDTPLPLGSTSAWQALPSLNAARTGLSAAVAADPDTAGLFHLYALLGEGLGSYEHLSVTVLPNGRQTVAASWTEGAESSSIPRSEFGAWVVDDVVSSAMPDGRTYLYLGGGVSGGADVGPVEAALVEAGGELAAFDDDPTAGDIVTDFSSIRTGYGTVAAAGRLFLFGGQAAQIRADATAAEIIDPVPELRNNSWNNEGLSMTTPRYRLGTAIQSAFIFLIGGQTNASGAATATTERVVW